MILKNYRNTDIFKEQDEAFLETWFDIKDKKVIHNIDTLYVTADIKEDYNEIASKDLIPWLEFTKNERDFEDIYLEQYDLFMTGLSFTQYCYALEKKDKFLIFFCRKKNTESTPPIFIQIRSQFLWLKGEHMALLEVHETLSKILLDYQMTITEYKENRIDFAYHTNYIKDMTSFFNINRLNSMQVSNFKQANLVLKLHGDDETKTEYISFGKRTSNNLFVRIYDKTTEVVEQGYKQFFIEHWKENGLINAYDKWLLEKCFMDKSMARVHKYRLEFYAQYGKDEELKEFVKGLLEDYEKHEYDVIKCYADRLTPLPTIIVNVEFQTKRKFYYTFDKEILSSLSALTIAPEQLKSIFKLLDNKKLVHNLLTQDVFRLVNLEETTTRKRNKSVTPFWELVQNCKIPFGHKVNDKMRRQYQKNLDLEALKKRAINTIATFSLYTKGENESDLIKDSLDFMEWINESDIEKADEYKKKKAPLLKGKLESTDNLTVSSRYALINREDGTYID